MRITLLGAGHIGQTIARLLSTSGDYERLFDDGAERVHHLIDPATGESPHGVHSVTILAADGLPQVIAQREHCLNAGSCLCGPIGDQPRTPGDTASHAAELLGPDEVQALLDGLKERAANLVASLSPNPLPITTLTQVLREAAAARSAAVNWPSSSSSSSLRCSSLCP